MDIAQSTNTALFTDDTITFGILILVLWLVLGTSKLDTPFWRVFYKYVPTVFLCYFIPSLLSWPLGIITPDGSGLYYMASRYLLPAAIILLCINIDLQEIKKLGSKALIMFLTATGSIILGGPFALVLVSVLFPNLLEVEPDMLWRGFSTVAGSWIGGGANQTAMKEIFEVPDDVFSNMLVVDILMANVLLTVLFFMVNFRNPINKWLRADNSAVVNLQNKMEAFEASISRKTEFSDLVMIAGIGFGGTALSHIMANWISPYLSKHREAIEAVNLHSLLSPFFWLIVGATTIGLALSFTRFKKIEGAGASKIATFFIYVLVAVIGMKMDVGELFRHPELFLVGFIWILFHFIVLFVVARIIRAPLFFIAVGSQANVGGAASAPVVAGAFHSSLAPVGVLLAVLGYALGTYGAIICALLMQAVV